jgi:Ran GTPase-activating protein (RanGAP) involved in mRNA processing and transport
MEEVEQNQQEVQDIEEELDKEFELLNSQLTIPKRFYDDPRFDMEYLNPEEEDSENSNGEEDEVEDFVSTDLEDSQIQALIKAGIDAYIRTCKKFDFFMFPMRTVTEKLNSSTVNLAHHGLCDKGCIAISQCIRVNTFITSLDLSNNGITLDGINTLLAVMQKNPSITELNLSQNRFGHKGISNQALNFYGVGDANNSIESKSIGLLIKQMLQKNGILKKLILRENKLSDSDIQEICEALSENYSLIYLDLSYNELGERSGFYISQMLSSNVDLKNLNLEWNKLRNLGCIHIANGLMSNNVVTCLNLNWNGIGDSATQKLSQMLHHNTALEELHISNNHIFSGPQSVKLIANSLKENNALRILNLANNPLDLEGAKALLSAVKSNENSLLQELNLEGCLDESAKKDQKLLDSISEISKSLLKLKI